MSKKLFVKVALLVAVVMLAVCVLAACSSTPSASTAPSAAPSEAAASVAPSAAAPSAAAGSPAASDNANAGKLIAWNHKSVGYYFFVIEQESMKRAIEGLGYTFESSNADSDAAKQFDQFVTFINKKPVAIVSDPIDSEGLIAAVDQAKKAGIAVGVVDTPTTGGDVDVTVAFDNKISGQMAAEEIVKRLKTKYGSEKGVVLNAYGAMSSWAWRLRKEGMDETMKKYPDIKYYAMPGEGDISKTQDALLNLLTKEKTVDAVHCPSDTPGIGLMQALKMKNLFVKRDDPKHVIFVTIDGEPVSVGINIPQGFYDATINQDCFAYAGVCIEMLDKYSLKGQKVPLGEYDGGDKYYWGKCQIVQAVHGPYVNVPPYVIDDTNCTDPRHWANIATGEFGIPYEMAQ